MMPIAFLSFSEPHVLIHFSVKADISQEIKRLYIEWTKKGTSVHNPQKSLFFKHPLPYILLVDHQTIGIQLMALNNGIA